MGKRTIRGPYINIIYSGASPPYYMLQKTPSPIGRGGAYAFVEIISWL